MSMLLLGVGNTSAIQNPLDSRLGTLYRWHDTVTPSTLWQDSGRTTPVTANNDSVGAWDDQSGNSRHLTQPTGAAKMIYKATAYGTPSIIGDGTSKFINDLNAIGSSYTIYVVGRSIRTLPGPGTNKVDIWLAGGVAGSGIGLEPFNEFASSTELRFYSEFCTSPYVNGAAYTYPATLTAGGPDMMLTAVNANTATSNTGTFVSHFDLSANYNPDPIKCVLVYATTHNATQISLIYNWARTKFTFS